LGRNAVQKVSASEGPISMPNLAPAVTVNADRDDHRDRDQSSRRHFKGKMR
jgi:hypothetical protein